MKNNKAIKGTELSALRKGTKPKLGILPVVDTRVEAPEPVVEKKVAPKKKKAPAKKKTSKAKKSEVKKDDSVKETI